MRRATRLGVLLWGAVLWESRLALFIHELARNLSIWFKPHVTLFSH